MYSQEYLSELINNKVEESLHLDYKAAGALDRKDPKPSEISKDVSSFANSDGGLIIYGIKEDPANDHLPISIDPVSRKLISKEWLEQIIQSKISPKIDNVVITPIAFNEDDDLVIYVVEIPKGTTAHQAVDKRYYKRYNFMSVPMDDYEIRDIFNRTQRTKLIIEDVKASVTGGRSSGDTSLKSADCKLEFQIANTGNVIENQYKLVFYLPTAIRRGNPKLMAAHYLRSEGDCDVFSIPNSSPLFQGEVTTISTERFELTEGMDIHNFDQLKVKLYYTSDSKESEFRIWEELTYQTRTLRDWGW